MSDDTLLDLDSLMEGTLDETEAAPDFVDPPSGKYRLRVKSHKAKATEKKDEETGADVTKNSLNLIVSVVETVEIADGEMPVENGSMFSMRYNMTREGLGYFKAFAQKVLGAEAIKGVSIRAIADELCNEEHVFFAAVRQTTSKYKGKDYTNINVNVLAQEVA